MLWVYWTLFYAAENQPIVTTHIIITHRGGSVSNFIYLRYTVRGRGHILYIAADLFHTYNTYYIRLEKKSRILTNYIIDMNARTLCWWAATFLIVRIKQDKSMIMKPVHRRFRKCQDLFSSHCCSFSSRSTLKTCDLYPSVSVVSFWLWSAIQMFVFLYLYLYLKHHLLNQIQVTWKGLEITRLLFLLLTFRKLYSTFLPFSANLININININIHKL